MAYDRYIAICHPLRYMTIMNHSVCMWLATACWIMGLIEPIGHIIEISKLSFCESHTINHFFCDIAVLMKLSCSSTLTIELLTYIIGTLISMMSFVLIITSYINIISSILKIQSVTGRHKAFSTCASHLTVVFVLYGSIFVTYFRPASTFSDSKISSFAYIAIAPEALCRNRNDTAEDARRTEEVLNDGQKRRKDVPVFLSQLPLPHKY
ncbi:olfactory receptor 1G1-like [Ambystoma mexicanum]|uniref:olfactory receptor 1G1-like n=1 Tax=Ambystoma mexicanum TaxID=8296 RepID=UPI0037E8CE8D